MLVKFDTVLPYLLRQNLFKNNDGTTKQDCELNAFYRMVKRLKGRFPQLKICLLLDSLYAASPVMDILKRYNWKYITTFKEGSMP